MGTCGVASGSEGSWNEIFGKSGISSHTQQCNFTTLNRRPYMSEACWGDEDDGEHLVGASKLSNACNEKTTYR